jgi:hypothetical protein
MFEREIQGAAIDGAIILSGVEERVMVLTFGVASACGVSIRS